MNIEQLQPSKIYKEYSNFILDRIHYDGIFHIVKYNDIFEEYPSDIEINDQLKGEVNTFLKELSWFVKGNFYFVKTHTDSIYYLFFVYFEDLSEIKFFYKDVTSILNETEVQS